MNTADWVALLIPLTFFVMMAVEAAVKTGRDWPDIPWWRAKGMVFFVMLMTINAVLPSLLPSTVLRYHLIDGTRLGIVGGVLLGYPCVSLAGALLHRAYHRYPLLWRYVHQLHHAPQHMDMAGSVLFTPFEVINNVLLSLIVTVLILGLDPLAAAITGYVAAFYGMFQHLNVRTPRWLGYLIQRPESHSVHHRRGFHAYNYSRQDLFIRHLDLVDHSRAPWIELRYHWLSLDLALQWQARSGALSSDFGASTQRQAWQALLTYFLN